MGKLNIAHHKSYHPYRQDNIARVRRDEEEARRKGVEEEDRALLADSESRLDALRQRVGSTGEDNARGEDDEALSGPSRPSSLSMGKEEAPVSSSLSNGASRHINLFEDLEQQSAVLAARASKKGPVTTAEDRGVALAPTKKDLNPWYSSRSSKDLDRDEVDGEDDRERRKGDDRRRRDQARKSAHDPLASIPRHLLNSTSSSHPSPPSSRPSKYPPRPTSTTSPSTSSHHDRSMPPPAHTIEARLTRESSERARAQELLRRKQKERERELMSNSSVTGTPSTVHGGMGGGTSDMYNREEVEEARRVRFGGRDGRGERGGGRDGREGWRQRGWEEDGRERERGRSGRSGEGGGRRSWDRR